VIVQRKEILIARDDYDGLLMRVGTGAGQRMASGMYFIRLEAPGCCGVEEVLVLRWRRWVS
jgi:hypothetical protein